MLNCPHCGKPLAAKVCPSCGADTREESIFCHRCGGKMERVASAAVGAEEDDFSKRILCSDGACIGVVNEQGICKVCGKPYRAEER